MRVENQVHGSASWPELGSGQVHVWPLLLASLPERAAWLSRDERERGSRYRFPHLRRRFSVLRAALRALAGRYLDVSPAALRFSPGARGKPRLSDPRDRLWFNMSYSDAAAIIAFGRSGELGVDLEQCRAEVDVIALAERFFAPEERRALQNRARDGVNRAFFDIWTRKEAYLKALGSGLSRPLDSFVVSARPGDRNALLEDRLTPGNPVAWRLLDLSVFEGYAAALAIGADVEYVAVFAADFAVRVLAAENLGAGRRV